ncbi:hypothetical protein H2248_002834 [Termitomyces sp. 'cryptogamus']|nr:hypothetical protein H2248_002834 [Termitomyces sp. 'cryptogamus']
MDTKVTTTKTISRGTLGLRFMQNALRAKQLQEVEIEKAEVKDDGQWEVDQRVRDAWGPAPSSSSSSQTISYETSYLPFIFSSDTSDSSSEADMQKARGRRVFNKHGIEETAKEEPEPTPVSTTVPDQKRFKVHPRPKSISAGSVDLFGFPDRAPSKPKNAKTAKQLIYDETGVGEDLHPRSSRQLLNSKPKSKLPPASPPLKPMFLKPAGVDDPHETHVTSAASDIIHGARSQKKSKRERPSAEHPDVEEDIKRKKKKKKIQKSTT